MGWSDARPVEALDEGGFASTNRLGSPLKSDQWYSFAKLVAVILARVDSDRTSARSASSSGWSIARNS
jgi:hypothetical protein